MEEILELLDIRALLIAFTALMFVFLIIVFIMWSKLNKLRKTYLDMLNGESSLNIESTLIELQRIASANEAKSREVEQQLHSIVQQMKHMKSNVGIYRYNAFAESGSDLSFSVAIVDEQMDGVVISGIHNRDETYVYAKPLSQGQSQYVLSPEEKEAIHRCVPKK